jgi:hypothetical protein
MSAATHTDRSTQAWRQERDRLRAKDARFDPATSRHLAGRGPRDGWRCLEVGAGAPAASLAGWPSGAPGGFIDLERVASHTWADGLWPASPSIHPAAKEVAMTTAEVSPITTTARRFGPMWRHAGGRNPTSVPAAESEHELVVLSRHRTSEGVVTYARCNCGELQIWLTGAGRPAHTLIKSVRGPGRAGGPG